MGGHRFAMLGGGLWTLFRFAVVVLLVMRASAPDPFGHVNLLWVGAPSLVVVALFGGSAFVAEARRSYLPLLRIGTLLTAISDAAVVLTSSYVPPADRAGPAADAIGPLVFIIAYGILAVDLLIFVALISYRPMSPTAKTSPDHRPSFESTTVEDE